MVEKFTVPPGHGYFALYLPWDQIRRLSELPADVEAVRVLPSGESPRQEYEDRQAWRAQPARERFYLLLRHPYFPRVAPNGFYEVARMEKVLQQYADVAQSVEESAHAES